MFKDGREIYVPCVSDGLESGFDTAFVGEIEIQGWRWRDPKDPEAGKFGLERMFWYPDVNDANDSQEILDWSTGRDWYVRNACWHALIKLLLSFRSALEIIYLPVSQDHNTHLLA